MEKYSEDGKILIKGPSDVITYTVREGVEDIACEAFAHNVNIEEVIIPESVFNIGSQAFKGCISLRKIILPDSLSGIEEEAFMGCKSLQEIHFGKEFIELGNKAFEDCTSLREILFSKENANMTVEWNLGNRIISQNIEGVTYIPEYCFFNCINLIKISLPKTLKKIGNLAFAGCINLESVIMPQNVLIHKQAFRDCPKVKINARKL